MTFMKKLTHNELQKAQLQETHYLQQQQLPHLQQVPSDSAASSTSMSGLPAVPFLPPLRHGPRENVEIRPVLELPTIGPLRRRVLSDPLWHDPEQLLGEYVGESNVENVPPLSPLALGPENVQLVARPSTSQLRKPVPPTMPPSLKGQSAKRSGEETEDERRLRQEHIQRKKSLAKQRRREQKPMTKAQRKEVLQKPGAVPTVKQERRKARLANFEEQEAARKKQEAERRAEEETARREQGRQKREQREQARHELEERRQREGEERERSEEAHVLKQKLEGDRPKRKLRLRRDPVDETAQSEREERQQHRRNWQRRCESWVKG